MTSAQKTKYAEIQKAFSMWKGGKGSPDKVEEGWFTTTEFASQCKCSRSRSQNKIQDMIKDGLLETKNFRIITANNNLKNTPHYRTKCTKK